MLQLAMFIARAPLFVYQVNLDPQGPQDQEESLDPRDNKAVLDQLDLPEREENQELPALKVFMAGTKILPHLIMQALPLDI